MEKLGRCVEKPELGPEETDFGEVRGRGERRATMGRQRVEGTARTKKQRPLGHPTIGAFGLARM